MNSNPISFIETLSQTETEPFRKIHKRKDLGEVLTKIPCMIALSHVIRKEKIPSLLKAVMMEKLKAPAIGTWTEVRNKCADFPTYKTELSKLFEELTAKKVKSIFNESMAKVRNELAHGADTQEATVTKYAGEMENQIKPLLELSFYQKLEFHSEPLPKDLSDFQRVTCRVGGTTYDLSPFVYFQGNSVLLFNGYDTDFVPTYVFYSESATMKREPRLKEVYREFLPMRDWQENPATYFFVRTPVYKRKHAFREAPTDTVTEWCKTGTEAVGVLQAPAGMGRSAFLSEVIERISTVENMATLEYFFEAGKDHGKEEFFERYFKERTDEYLSSEISESTFEKTFEKTLESIRESGKRILFLFDLPDKAPGNVKKYLEFVLRIGGRILLTAGPAETSYTDWKTSTKIFPLPPLREENFETIWQEILGQREFKNPAKIEKIKKIALSTSAGNPRVIRLWLGSIRQDRTGLGKRPLEMMPGELQNYYESVFKALTERGLNMTIIFGILFLLTGSKRAVSLKTMSEILGKTVEEIETSMQYVIDFVVPEEGGFVLYHSTLGEFLKLKYPTPYLNTLKKSGWGFTAERDYIKRNLATF